MKDRANRVAGTRASLWRDERGFVLVFFAVALPALIGLVGLAVDGARLIGLDGRLSALADAAALAAANRLDRSAGALPAARAAATALADGAGGGLERTRLSFRFAATLSDLRADPTFTLADASGATAAFVEVTTADASLTTSFLGLVGISAATLRRRATAESQYYACDVTPAAFCHRDPEAFAAAARPGRQYLLTLDPTFPDGSVAILDPTDDPNGRRAIRTLASNAPAFCYANAALRPNLTAAELDEALNIRFDRYVTPRGPVAPDIAVFPPAPNIVQGRLFETCASSPEGGGLNPPYRLPRDAGFRVLGRSSAYDGGIGDWKTTSAYGGSGFEAASALDEYLAWHHGDKSPLVQGALRASPTRYDLYLRELGLDRATETVPVPTRDVPSATMPRGGPLAQPYQFQRENPAPRCYAGPLPATDARRRILYLSIADCRGFPATATPAALSRHVGKFFLTEPSEGGRVLVELVGLLKPGADDGKLRHVVQLVETR